MLKYKIDILKALKENGYSMYYIRKNGLLSESTLQKIRNDIMISTDNLNKLCCLLNMNIDEIIEYIETDDDINYKNTNK